MTSRVSYRVEAIGSTDAADIAKRRARDEGLRVSTVARVEALEPDKGRDVRAWWLVVLAIREPER